MKTRNYSIDVFRLIFAFFVVSCHSNIFIEFSSEVYLFAAQFFPRFCLPFFFVVSGYYYIKALQAGKPVFKKQIVSLLKAYILWSVIYSVVSLAINVIGGEESLGKFFVQKVIDFFVHGTYFHFWFFTALIYSVLLSTLFHKWSPKRGIQALAIISVCLFVFGCICTSHNYIGFKLPGIREMVLEDETAFSAFRNNLCMGLPYFMMGYFINRAEGWLEKTSKKKLAVIGIAMIVLYFAEIAFLMLVLQLDRFYDMFFSIYPLSFIIVAFLLKNPKEEWEKYAPMCKRLSGYIFYVHPLIIKFLQMSSGFLAINIPSLILFVIVLLLAMGSGYVLILLSKRIKVINYLI